jgi:hypothetical protein
MVEQVGPPGLVWIVFGLVIVAVVGAVRAARRR